MEPGWIAIIDCFVGWELLLTWFGVGAYLCHCYEDETRDCSVISAGLWTRAILSLVRRRGWRMVLWILDGFLQKAIHHHHYFI